MKLAIIVACLLASPAAADATEIAVGSGAGTTHAENLQTRVESLREQVQRLKRGARFWMRAARDAKRLLAEAEPEVATSSPAGASPFTPPGEGSWAATADCESGDGDGLPPYTASWAEPDGLGPDVTGGLQIATQTWLAYGGGAYASKAMYASAAEQIAVAWKILAGQGPGAWPNCPTP